MANGIIADDGIKLDKALICGGARGGAVGCGTALQVGRSLVRFPMVSLKIFH